MTEPNAIERLRETVKFLFTYHDKEPYQKVMADLAAVDALHQAAKALGELRLGPGAEPFFVAENSAWHALAAAVRRVDGKA